MRGEVNRAFALNQVNAITRFRYYTGAGHSIIERVLVEASYTCT